MRRIPRAERERAAALGRLRVCRPRENGGSCARRRRWPETLVATSSWISSGRLECRADRTPGPAVLDGRLFARLVSLPTWVGEEDAMSDKVSTGPGRHRRSGRTVSEDGDVLEARLRRRRAATKTRTSAARRRGAVIRRSTGRSPAAAHRGNTITASPTSTHRHARRGGSDRSARRTRTPTRAPPRTAPATRTASRRQPDTAGAGCPRSCTRSRSRRAEVERGSPCRPRRGADRRAANASGPSSEQRDRDRRQRRHEAHPRHQRRDPPCRRSASG